MVCQSLTCPCNKPLPDGFNAFLFHLAEASYAMDRIEQFPDDPKWKRKLEGHAMSGMWAGWWNPAFPGLKRALKNHPADFVPPYLRKATDG